MLSGSLYFHQDDIHFGDWQSQFSISETFSLFIIPLYKEAQQSEKNIASEIRQAAGWCLNPDEMFY